MRERLIEEALGAEARPQTSGCQRPPEADPVEIAEYLAGVLEDAAARHLEAHLASCASCRELAALSGLAVLEQEVAEKVAAGSVARRGFGPWLAWAALVALVLGSLVVWRGREAGVAVRLRSVGVDPAVFSELPSPLRRQLRRALDGRLPEVRILADPVGGESDNALRGSSPEAALPISPRWSFIRSPRPMFRWYPSPLAKGGDLYTGEVFLLDEEENLFGRIHFSGPPDSDGLSTAAYPADFPPLEPGRAYFWKVNETVDGHREASEYVPFRVAVGEREPPGAESDFRQVVESASIGLYEESLTRLGSLRVENGGMEIRRRLLRALLIAKRCPASMLEEEIQRWAGRVAEEAP